MGFILNFWVINDNNVVIVLQLILGLVFNCSKSVVDIDKVKKNTRNIYNNKFPGKDSNQDG